MPLSDLNLVGYSSVGDIVVMMIVSIFLILIRATYIKPTREFRVFKWILFVLVLTFVGVGFHITKDNTAVTGANFFPVEYLFFVLLLLFSMMRYKQRIYRPIIWAFVATIFFALFAMYIQGIHHQQSFTTVTFVFPAAAV